ncbi:Crp/Fnr family transcriptional regulator [Hymenobacter sp. 15J16-1T3B]|uniref:Crp/Fnr family transcriptional regulator n=1 Tax=Hymenobacter sp. 15J16-1T3B TaxID=2886941 RepID=UPI001D0FAC22|nr:Crp/Fnr family transcriptional regulator [Hymenobacter sp. 15J16-1T3B]MCC3158432.1 Crp/Fnr family transcriptional regulator [Hymenobacter sp. 15J16-1T3B]
MDAKHLLRQHIAKTVALTDEQFEHVYAHFEPLSYKKGQALIAEGDVVTSEFFVVQGCLKTFHLTNELKMFILQFAMPTWWASDYQALYSGQRATVGVDCVTDVELLRLSAENREKLCHELHDVERFFRWRTNWGYVAAHKRLLSFMSTDVRQRYEELLKQYPLLYQFVPKNLIAAYLGVSRETLSRLYQSRHEA